MLDYKDERSLEQVYRSVVRGLYARLASNYDFIHSKLGDDGIQLIADMSREYGLSIASRARNRLRSNDITAVAEYLLRIFNTVSWDRNGLAELEKVDDSRVIIKASECPLHFKNPQMCLAHTTMEKTVVETLNPSLRYRIGKSIPAGDGYCEHIIEIRPPGDTVDGSETILQSKTSV
jgi:predicted ArsR family transcriptional regulator